MARLTHRALYRRRQLTQLATSNVNFGVVQMKKNTFPSWISMIVIRAVGCAACALVMSSPSVAQQKIWGPAESSLLHQLTSFSSDFSGSELYDFKNPIRLEVILQDVQIPEEFGYAQLMFNIISSSENVRLHSDDPNYVYLATLQTSQELERLGIRKSDFKRGLPATITGWPATRLMRFGSFLLVDEVDLYQSHDKNKSRAKKLKMHEGNDELKKHKLGKSNTRTDEQ